MRLDPKLVHPSLFKATDAFTLSGGVGYDPKMVAAHQNRWMQEYGTGCAAWCVGGCATFAGTLMALRAFEADKATRGFVMLILIVAMLIAGGIGFFRHMRRLSVAELESLLPVLSLSDAGGAYAETIVALHRSGRPKADVEEAMTALNALLDEEARLTAMRERLVGAEPLGMVARLDAEHADLQGKMDGSTDPGAREAYAQSIALLDERIAGLRADGGGLERIDAHLALLRQAVFATRDAARRLGTAINPEAETDSLRAAVARARAQTGETERALTDLRTI